MPSFTKKAIIESFLKLLNERPLNQITVKDIVEDCGINRNSFYYHFDDLPALVEEVLRSEADRLIAGQAAVGSMEDCLRVGIDFVLKNKKAAYHIYNSIHGDTYAHYVDRVCGHVVAQYIDTAAQDIQPQPEDREIIVSFLSYELAGLIMAWMRDGMRSDIFGRLHRMCVLFDGMVKTALQRSADGC